MLDLDVEPVRENYEFAGWYTTESAANGLDEGKAWKMGDRVTGNLHLYAGWKAVFNAQVTFENGNGTTTEETVLVGEKVKKPIVDPVRKGFAFTGWYTDAECTAVYNFSQAVMADIVLYAGWEAEEGTENIISVTAAGNEDAEISVYPQEVLAGEMVSAAVACTEGKVVDTATAVYTDKNGAEKNVALTIDEGKGSFVVPADVDAEKGMQVVVTVKDAPQPTATPTPAPTATATAIVTDPP